MRTKICVPLAFAAALAAIPTIAHAQPARMEIRISGIVPTICRVEFPSAPRSDAGAIDLGTMSEFCNQPNGYRILLRHPAGLDGATLSVGGAQIPLSPSGETVVVDSNAPAIKQNAVALSFGDEAVELSSLSFRAEAKGATF